MRRRDMVVGAALLPGLAALPFPGLSRLGGRAFGQAAQGSRFGANIVRDMARSLAAKAYEAPDRSLPKELEDLTYDAYRDIRFNVDRTLWRGRGLPFEVQLLHRGFLFRDRVDLAIVNEGVAQPLPYKSDDFRFDHGLKPPDPKLDLGFSGFRIHAPINRPDYFDEVAVFQGASYFRAVAKGQVYGSSARGLAIKTGDAGGEEFPAFKAFWLETPRPGVGSIVVHGLLDSPSAAAAHRFTIQPGEATVMTVEMALYPRVDIDQCGLGALTSMFMFGPNDRDGIDDFRSAVRDAQGLAILSGNGEQLWRPLANPQRLQLSAFAETNVRGFGLLQRQRSFFDYQDLEARYERRPSTWVEPIGDWGEGAVHLVEIPTPSEIHDNIVAFWRPKDPLRKGAEYIYTYRLHWLWDLPAQSPLARVAATSTGGTPERRLFVLDLVGNALRDLPPDALQAKVTASKGKISSVVLQPNPDIQGYRLSFALAPEDADLSELRAEVLKGDQPVCETWIYRWTP